MISKLVEFSFENVFSEKYDFFATIFEYLIKDYNKDFGKYAEYYTPNSIARIIAKILAPDPTQNVTLWICVNFLDTFFRTILFDRI